MSISICGWNGKQNISPTRGREEEEEDYQGEDGVLYLHVCLPLDIVSLPVFIRLC
jgi:hypothetical protein